MLSSTLEMLRLSSFTAGCPLVYHRGMQSTPSLRYPEPLLLASGSPRRIEMLSSLGFTLVVQPPDVDESVFDHLPIPLRVVALAEIKVRASSALAPSPPQIGRASCRERV